MFAKDIILKGEIIDYFVGELISHAEADKRTEDDKGGYIIYLDINYCVDCYETCRIGECLASKSNTPVGLINADTGRKAIANAKLIIRIMNTPDLSDPLDIISERTIYVAYLKAICDIQCDQEIIYPYGRKYNHYS